MFIPYNVLVFFFSAYLSPFLIPYLIRRKSQVHVETFSTLHDVTPYYLCVFICNCHIAPDSLYSICFTYLARKHFILCVVSIQHNFPICLKKGYLSSFKISNIFSEKFLDTSYNHSIFHLHYFLLHVSLFGIFSFFTSFPNACYSTHCYTFTSRKVFSINHEVHACYPSKIRSGIQGHSQLQSFRLVWTTWFTTSWFTSAYKRKKNIQYTLGSQ